MSRGKRRGLRVSVRQAVGAEFESKRQAARYSKMAQEEGEGPRVSGRQGVWGQVEDACVNPLDIQPYLERIGSTACVYLSSWQWGM